MSERDAARDPEAPGPSPDATAASSSPAAAGPGNGAPPPAAEPGRDRAKARSGPADQPAGNGRPAQATSGGRRRAPASAESGASGPGSTEAESSVGGSGSTEAESGDGEGPPARKPRRRGSRGGRKRSKARTEGATADAGTDVEDGAGDVASEAASPTGQGKAEGQGRRRGGGQPKGNGATGGERDQTKPRAKAEESAGTRGAGAKGGAAAADDRTPELPDPPGEGRPSVEAAARALVPKMPPPRPKPKIGDSIPPEALRPAEPADAGKGAGAGEGTRKRRRRRGGRGRGAAPRPGTAQPIEALLPEGVELDEETLERRKGRERKGRPVGRYSMCVHVTERATQIAVLEGRALIEHYVSRPSDDVSQIHGNIYLGRVQNVLPGMEAAFIDIGTPKNAVLYRGDVHYDPEDVERRGQTPRIEDMLKAGQTIVCQVTKNPIGAKGARLTQEVSLPGRFVVLIPNSSTYGISKRLSDDERKRLRQILDRVKPAEHGIIVRTAAQDVTSEEIEDDVRRLAAQWAKIDALAKRSKAPALLYREPDMAVRVIREEFNQDYRNVAIDDPALFEAVRDYVESISPELVDRVEHYDRDQEPLPLFERYHVHEQLHKALDRKVWLPSGGSLIIEHTEALTVIDVNTGKNVGRSSLEETVFKNNLEAAVEIARQLRLRDIGGIIVIDFIDMERKDNRDEVIRVFRDALSRDKTRTQVFEISELGLCEMTRKRIGEGLLESFAHQCPECEGRGLLIDDELLPT